MAPHEELLELARVLKQAGEEGGSPPVRAPVKALEEAAKDVGRSFSGSWLGYHAYVYYAGLSPRPPGAHFSQEWGLGGEEWLGLSSVGDWNEFDPEFVKAEIFRQAGNPDLRAARNAAGEAEKTFKRGKADILSIFENQLSDREDNFLRGLTSELEKLNPVSKHDAIKFIQPNGRIMTRDTTALGQGMQVPPHLDVWADTAALNSAFGICIAAADICSRGSSHLARRARQKLPPRESGKKVFIGHGKSAAWRELKDFLQDRLGLAWDEFNRVPVAGVTNVARLSEMLSDSAIALLIMTAEDELADGEMRARMNVIHEAGLFQGRLGFTKAIVLLEDGCCEFSNIQGLGQIRFPKAGIAAAFEEVRRVLEREGMLDEM